MTVRSAAPSTAMFLPELIAMPRFACARAPGVVDTVAGHGQRGAAALQPPDSSDLALGQHAPAKTSSAATPMVAAMLGGDDFIVPGHQDGSQARARWSRLTGAREVRLHRVRQAR